MSRIAALLATLSAEQPVLVAGPTASGKSALALDIAQAQGGVIVNADASQVYECWRIITARPDAEEEARVPHLLYGHVAATDAYSTGHWLREVRDILQQGQRPIITGGTGLYFAALTEGLAHIPPTPDAVRARADTIPLPDLLADLDAVTLSRIDQANRARAQRAWEVFEATGRPLSVWQDETGPPDLPLDRCLPIVFDVNKSWLNDRIKKRFEVMLTHGALDEIRAVHPDYNPMLPAHRAIGVPELMAHIEGRMSLTEATQAAVIATRQFAKRQRTWMRKRMRNWHPFEPA